MHTLISWVVSAVAIAIAAYILPGITVSGVVAVILLALVLGIINTFIKPVLKVLTLPLTIMTLGLFSLVLNTLLIMLAAAIVPGVDIANFWWALLFGILISLITAVLEKFDGNPNT